MGGVVTAQRDFIESTNKKLADLDVIDKDQLTKIEKEVGDVSMSISEFQLAQKDATEKALSADQTIEKMLKEQKDSDERFKSLELSIAASIGTGTSAVALTKYDRSIGEYFRKGDKNGQFGDVTSQEFIENTGSALAKAFVQTSDPVLAGIFKSLLVGINPDGGYFVTPQFGGVITGRVFESSPMRPLSNVVTTTSDIFSYIIDDDEADSGWVGEVDDRGDTRSAQVGELNIHIHEIFAQPKASQKMLDDAGFDIAGWHQGKVSDRFTREENKAFVSGDGSKRPKGFNTYGDAADSNVYERGKIGTLTTTNAGVLNESDDLKDTQNRLKQIYQSNATWAMKRLTWADVTKLKDSQGRYLFDMISNLRDGDIMQLLGRPVVLMDDMPDVASGANAIAYADFRRTYTIVDRMGIRVLRDPFTSKPFIKFYTTKRVGGDVTSFDAIKRLKIQ